MRALIFDRQDIFRSALRQILLSYTDISDVLEARSASEFVSIATHHDDIDLMIAYPSSVDLTIADCVCLAERLLEGAELVLFRDSRDTDGLDTQGVTFLDRAVGIDDLLNALDNGTGNYDPCLQTTARPLSPAMGLSNNICQTLSRRQKQIMAMVAEGLANKEIAARLGIAEGTVKAHIHAVFKALGVTNRTQAVVRYGGELRGIAAAPH